MGPALRFVVVAAAFAAGCTSKGDDRPLDFMIPVSVEEVRLGSVEERIVATGTLRAPEVITLAVESAGVLEISSTPDGRRLGEGDRVKAGDVIVRVTGEDARVAARRAATQRRHDAALYDLEAARTLKQQHLINQTEVERLEVAYQDAKLDLERSLLAEERNRLTTPIDGVILTLARNADGQQMASGQLVSLGQAVAQIARTNLLVADIDLVGKDVTRVRVGSQARVSYHALDKRHFDGKVQRLAPIIDVKTRALRAEVAVDNLEGVLLPGMFVEVAVLADRHENVPVIPRRAISSRGGKSVVFVQVGQRVQQRTVELGLAGNDVIEALNGVVAGENIVVSGIETLSDQTQIRITGL